MRVTVVINGRFLTRPATGVERFASGMLGALARRRSDLEVLIPAAGEVTGGDLPAVTLSRVGRLRGHAWEQLDLPRALAMRGRPLLVDLANTGPLGYREQIVVVHDAAPRRHPDAYSRAFRAVYRVLIPRLVTDSRAVATVSAFSRGELADLYGRPDIAVIPNAVGDWVHGPQRPVGAVDPHRPFALVVGSRSAHKDIETAVAGHRRHREAGGGYRLVIAGGTHASFAAGSGASGSAADPDVVRLGRVEDAELSWLYAHAHALVFPSRYEGFGMPPLEAQACDTPVIASDIPAVREVLGEEGALWFRPGDAAGVAGALARLEQEGGLAARLIESGRQNVRRYSWAHSAELLDRLIALAGDERDAGRPPGFRPRRTGR